MAPFDPFRQRVIVKIPGGYKAPIPLEDINAVMNYGIRICINYGTQIGASAVLFVMLVVLTRPEKRSTPVFALNALALLINTIRNILQCVYFTGPFYDIYAVLIRDYSKVPASEYGASVAGVILTLLMVICLEVSLVLQVQAVCAVMTNIPRRLILMLSTTIALVAVGFRFALTVENIKSILKTVDFAGFQWLAATSNYVITGSICYASFVFVTKLGVALKERRRLGLRQFGPMQIVFIMGCQTLFVPAFITIIANFSKVPELSSQSLTVVALFLPLSSLWASHSVGSHTTSTSQFDKSHRKRLLGYFGGDSGKSEKKSANTTTQSDTPTTQMTLSPNKSKASSEDPEQ